MEAKSPRPSCHWAWLEGITVPHFRLGFPKVTSYLWCPVACNRVSASVHLRKVSAYLCRTPVIVDQGLAPPPIPVEPHLNQLHPWWPVSSKVACWGSSLNAVCAGSSLVAVCAGSSLVAVCGLLLAVASLVMGHRLSAHTGFRSCGTRA